MSYSRRQLERVSPHRHGLKLWAARLHRIWKAYLRAAARVAGVMGTCDHRAFKYVFLLPHGSLWLRNEPSDGASWRTRTATVLAGPPEPVGRCERNTDAHPRYFRPLPRFRRGPARRRGPRCGGPGGTTFSTKERRCVPRGRHRVVPRRGRDRASRARGRRLLREADAQVRTDLDDGPSRVAAHVRELPARHEELSRRQALGQRNHPLVAGRRLGQDPLLRAPSLPRCRGLPHGAHRTGRDPHGRWRRGMGDAHGGARPSRRRHTHGGRDPSRGPLSTLARDALFDLHGLPGLCGE